MWRFWTLIKACVLSISISPTSCWKHISNKCYWKVSRGIAILIGPTCTNLIGISNETSVLTYPTRFKLVDVINLTGWYDQINVGTTIVPIKNNPSYVVNIKSSSL
jgi:hypothetical protein